MPTYRVLYTDRGDYSNTFDIERSFYDPTGHPLPNRVVPED